jgi:hypothetical protein
MKWIRFIRDYTLKKELFIYPNKIQSNLYTQVEQYGKETVDSGEFRTVKFSDFSGQTAVLSDWKRPEVTG